MARSKALSELLAALVEEGADAPETIDANVSPIEDWIGQAAALPMFSDIRTVVVRHLLRIPTPKSPSASALKGMIGALPDSSRLILVADDEPGDDQEQRALTDLGRRWAKFLSDAGSSVYMFDVKRNSLGDDIRARFHEQGKAIDRRTAGQLAQMTDFDTGSIATEIDKLVAYVGDRAEVTEHDLNTIVSSELSYNVFRLVEAAILGEAGTATDELRSLFGKAKTEYGVSGQILTLIRRQLHLMWQARMALDNRAEGGAKAVEHKFPKRYNLTKEKEFSRNKAMGLAKRTTLEHLTQLIAEVAKTDARIKGNEPGGTARDELEQLVLRMSSIAALSARY